MRKNKRLKNWRIYVVFLNLCLVFGVIVYRFFSLQVVDHKFYLAKAENQHQISKTLEPRRGTIFMKDRFGDVYPLALNKEYASVYAVPSEIKNPKEVAAKIVSFLEIEDESILKRLNKKNDPYEPIKSKISDEEFALLKKNPIKGIYLSAKENRFYPYGEVASAITGFVSAPDKKFIGQYGLEKFYDKELAGKNGTLIADKGVGDTVIFTGEQNFQPAVDGSDIILTIDPNIQFKAEEILKSAYETWQAEEGTVIVMDPKTGAIRAMADYPSFNLNEYSKAKDINVYLNSAVQSIFEPGSIVKAITMATGLDTGVITPETKYVDEGIVTVNGHDITNFDNQAYGEKTMREVLQMSLNTGVIFVQKKIPKPVFKEYFEKFGFSEKLGVDLPGEVSGNIINLNSNRDINYATASFGQGIAVTPLRLLTAIGALANKGVMMKPYIVEEVKRPDGKTTKTQPEETRRVVSAEAAEKVVSMMVDVVQNGFDKRASVEGYFVAGKTGTAQIPNGKGGYSEEYIHSFVGFAPAYDPKFAVLIKLDKPKGNRFASNTLSAPFGELMNYLLSYYEVPPDQRNNN